MGAAVPRCYTAPDEIHDLRPETFSGVATMGKGACGPRNAGRGCSPRSTFENAACSSGNVFGRFPLSFPDFSISRW